MPKNYLSCILCGNVIDVIISYSHLLDFFSSLRDVDVRLLLTTLGPRLVDPVTSSPNEFARAFQKKRNEVVLVLLWLTISNLKRDDLGSASSIFLLFQIIELT